MIRIRTTISVLSLAGLVLIVPAEQTASGAREFPVVRFVQAEPMVCSYKGVVVYDGYTQPGPYTYGPLIRGPLYAPVVFWLGGDDPAPVIPIDFTVSDADIWWQTVDAGPLLSGGVYGTYTGRPLGNGPPVTDTAERVTCSWGARGHYDFGTFRVTARMAHLLGLPAATVGRFVNFAGEANPSLSVPRSLFPTTARPQNPTLPTPTADAFSKQLFTRSAADEDFPSDQVRGGGIECVRLRDGELLYRGSAWTLPPLVRGHTWSPMTFWIGRNSAITPTWFWSYVGDGTWRTVDHLRPRTGTYSAYQDGRPSGYDGAPVSPISGVECRWDTPLTTTYRVTAALVQQLGLPETLVGRKVELTAVYSNTHAYAPEWMFR